jgi:hypothetical protein
MDPLRKADNLSVARISDIENQDVTRNEIDEEEEIKQEEKA